MRILICFFMISLSSCANHTNQFLSQLPLWNDKSQKIGVIIGNTSAPSAYKDGHINFAGNKPNDHDSLQLNKHLKTLNIANLTDVALDITQQLKNKGLDVKFLPEKMSLKSLRKSDMKSSIQALVNFDHKTLKSRHNIDKLVVIDLVRIGTIRNYYGFVPVNEAHGLSHLDAYVINLNKRQLEWKKSVIKKIKTTTTTPNANLQFDGITKAVLLAFDQSKHSLISHFSE